MTEHDKKVEQIILNVRKSLRIITQKIREEKSVFPEMLSESIKSLISAKIELGIARNKDSGLFLDCDTPNYEKFKKIREADENKIFRDETPKEVRQVKKRISYTRV